MVPKGLINVSLHVTVSVFDTLGILAMDLLISHLKGPKHLINFYKLFSVELYDRRMNKLY